MGAVQGKDAQLLRNAMLNFEPDQDSIGVIFGSINTIQFKFAIISPSVKRTGYIQVWHDDHGWVLGQIIELNLETNITYSKAQELSHEHLISGLGLKENIPEQKYPGCDSSIDGKLAGVVNIIGYRDRNGIVQLPSSPFNPGQPVYPATINLIKNVLGMDINVQTGAYIGLLRNHKLKVHLDINQLVQKHISVIAKTGSGKSYIVGVLVEELIKRQIPILIIDPHGEYSALMHPNIDEHDTRLMSTYDIRPCGYPDAIYEYSLNPKVNLGTIPLRLPNYGFTGDSIVELLGLRGTGVQTTILYKAINRLMAHKSYFTLKELRTVIEFDRNNAKWHLINSLENLQATGIFSENPTQLSELIKPGQATIINLRGATPQHQQIVITQLSRQLFEARKVNKIPALMLVLEEAHQFCPQQGRMLSSNILRTIASEGRKFGLGLCVVSQRPALVDKNVLSQCNTQVILKVTNPNDLKAIINSVEGLNSGMIDEIQRLPVSTAIVIGSGIQVPIFVDVRVRETKHGGRPVDIFSNVDTFKMGRTIDEDTLDNSWDEYRIDDELLEPYKPPQARELSIEHEVKAQDDFDIKLKDSDLSASEQLTNLKKTRSLSPELNKLSLLEAIQKSDDLESSTKPKIRKGGHHEETDDEDLEEDVDEDNDEDGDMDENLDE